MLGRRPYMLRMPFRRPHGVAHLFSCSIHPTDLTPGDMWAAPLQVVQLMTSLLQFADLHPLLTLFCIYVYLVIVQLSFKTVQVLHFVLKLASNCKFVIYFADMGLSFVLQRLSIYFADCSIDSIKLSFSSFICHSFHYLVTFLWKLFILKWKKMNLQSRDIWKTWIFAYLLLLYILLMLLSV